MPERRRRRQQGEKKLRRNMVSSVYDIRTYIRTGKLLSLFLSTSVAVSFNLKLLNYKNYLKLVCYECDNLGGVLLKRP